MTEPQTIRRALMTADTVGGVWTFTLELAEALASNGVEVMLAAMGGAPSAAQYSEAAAIPGLQLLAGDYKLEWMDDPWCDVQAAGDWLLGLEAQFAPDVVHLNSYVHGALGWRAPVVMTAHSCVLSWWQAVHGEPAPPEWGRYRREVARGFAAARIVTAPSAFMLRAIEAHYGAVHAGRIVPNGRAASRYKPLPKEPFILSAGRLWDRAKNLAILESIAGSLAWPVYVAGQQQRPDGGFQPAVHCRALGQLSAPDLARWYGRAAIYALPVRYEPFGLSALEAALSACVLVLGDVPSLREIWDGAAVFVPPGDRSAWKAELNRLIVNPRARRGLAVRARQRAGEFTPERMAREYAACYAEAARGREAACAS